MSPTDNSLENARKNDAAVPAWRRAFSALPIAVAAGVLAGLFEVAWTFLAPLIIDQWRAALPDSFEHLMWFYAAAIAVDGLLGLALGLVLAILWLTLARFGCLPKRVRLINRVLILAAAAGYLFNGWTTVVILNAAQTETTLQRVIVAVGALSLIAVSIALGTALDNAVERGRRRAPAVAWSLAALVSLAVALPLYLHGRGNPETTPAPVVSTGAERPNIVLVTIDTLRGDYVHGYGHPWIETPVLDALIRDGVAFDAALSQAPSTTPSHCTLMTSVYPFDHDAENGRPMKPELTTLAQTLRAGGYETVAFTSATTTRSVNTGLDKGFERYSDSLVTWSEFFGRDELQHLIFFYLANFTQNTQIPGDIVTNRAVRWLDDRGDRPFFVWLHYFDPHEPYGSPPPYRDMYAGKTDDGLPMPNERARYAEDVTYADHQLGRFIDELKKRGLYDDALLIVTADHGEAFGERHAHITEVGHGHYLSDVTQRVPLIVKTPREVRPGRRVAEQVELIDVAPTVLSLLGVAPPPGFAGNSFAALLGDRYPPYEDRHAYAFCMIHVDDPDAPSGRLYLRQFAVRTNEWKFIERPRLDQYELYNLQQDPCELRDVSEPKLAEVEAFHAAIAGFWRPLEAAPSDPSQGLSPALARQLEMLGYIDDDAK